MAKTPVKFKSWEDEIVIKYSYKLAVEKLPHRFHTSIRNRRDYLTKKGVILQNCKNIEANISKISPYVIPGLDKTKIGQKSVILILYQYLGTTEEELKAKNREADIAFKRKIFSWYLREKLKLGLDKIGGYINRDHASILYYHKDINNKISINDREVTKIVNELNKILCV